MLRHGSMSSLEGRSPPGSAHADHFDVECCRSHAVDAKPRAAWRLRSLCLLLVAAVLFGPALLRRGSHRRRHAESHASSDAAPSSASSRRLAALTDDVVAAVAFEPSQSPAASRYESLLASNFGPDAPPASNLSDAANHTRSRSQRKRDKKKELALDTRRAIEADHAGAALEQRKFDRRNRKDTEREEKRQRRLALEAMGG
mmetsp:Transcript_3975/g.12254  ORF Transcript_3975/g.12254 Transcript_3975/m.12254 type:complete len:201 (+) Transcript_3975:132-734(+)